MKVLILGANGFIGTHLSENILTNKDWEIFAMDLADDKLENCLSSAKFHFKKGDIIKEKEWIKEQIQNCDVILPLVAIATPATYVNDPLRIFELDFEANLEIVRQCVEFKKRLVFPSTSEVYGMCPDSEFTEDESPLVTGPINKERWIYSTSKQLMDRVIYAYGKHNGLDYTLFRPFNWYGPRLDNPLNPNKGGSRALTQFIGNVLRGEDINLVDGGKQQRCFTYIADGIDALVRIIENKDGKATNGIFNIGNPEENISIRQLAEMLKKTVSENYPKYAENAKKVNLVDIDAEKYYGKGYQDVQLRVPAVRQAKEKLDWEPTTDMITGLRQTLDFYLA